jgi:hypothetical protein
MLARQHYCLSHTSSPEESSFSLLNIGFKERDEAGCGGSHLSSQLLRLWRSGRLRLETNLSKS